jgi:hypothetical protein
MARYVAVSDVQYDKGSNVLRAKLRAQDGSQSDFEIEGPAFAELMGLANITNAVIHHFHARREMPLIPVNAIHTGLASHGEPREHGMSLTLLIPQMGALHFFLPPALEIALRERLQLPSAASSPGTPDG